MDECEWDGLVIIASMLCFRMTKEQGFSRSVPPQKRGGVQSGRARLKEMCAICRMQIPHEALRGRRALAVTVDSAQIEQESLKPQQINSTSTSHSRPNSQASSNLHTSVYE